MGNDTYVSRGSAVGSGGDTAGERINPSTEEKQDDIITALGAAAGGGGLATEDKQDDIVTAIEANETDVEAVKDAVDTVNTNLGTLEDDVETINTNLGTLEDDVEALFGSASLIRQSTTGGAAKITIPATPYQVAGANQACRSCLVVHASDNAVYMNIGAVADADDFIIPKNTIVPVPVDNTSDLNFFGTQADTIRVLWRN